MGTKGVRQVLGKTANANVPPTLLINPGVHNFFIPNDFKNTNFELGGLGNKTSIVNTKKMPIL